MYIKIVPRLLVQYEKLLGTIRDVYLQVAFEGYLNELCFGQRVLFIGGGMGLRLAVSLALS